MQITRQRMKPEMNINTSEFCPTCNGTGKITSTLLLVDEIEKKLLYLVTHQHKNLTLTVHPILHSHLTKGWWFNSIKAKWSKKFKTRIKVSLNNNYHLTEFHFFDQDEEEIKL
jgi:ribonuclease G